MSDQIFLLAIKFHLNFFSLLTFLPIIYDIFIKNTIFSLIKFLRSILGFYIHLELFMGSEPISKL